MWTGNFSLATKKTFKSSQNCNQFSSTILSIRWRNQTERKRKKNGRRPNHEFRAQKDEDGVWEKRNIIKWQSYRIQLSIILCKNCNIVGLEFTLFFWTISSRDRNYTHVLLEKCLMENVNYINGVRSSYIVYKLLVLQRGSPPNDDNAISMENEKFIMKILCIALLSIP